MNRDQDLTLKCLAVKTMLTPTSSGQYRQHQPGDKGDRRLDELVTELRL